MSNCIYTRKVRIKGALGEIEIIYEDSENCNTSPVKFDTKHIDGLLKSAISSYKKLESKDNV